MSQAQVRWAQDPGGLESSLDQRCCLRVLESLKQGTALDVTSTIWLMEDTGRGG